MYECDLTSWLSFVALSVMLAVVQLGLLPTDGDVFLAGVDSTSSARQTAEGGS